MYTPATLSLLLLLRRAPVEFADAPKEGENTSLNIKEAPPEWQERRTRTTGVYTENRQAYTHKMEKESNQSPGSKVMEAPGTPPFMMTSGYSLQPGD